MPAFSASFGRSAPIRADLAPNSRACLFAAVENAAAIHRFAPPDAFAAAVHTLH
jgi:hypothetical protein